MTAGVRPTTVAETVNVSAGAAQRPSVKMNPASAKSWEWEDMGGTGRGRFPGRRRNDEHLTEQHPPP